MTPQTKTIIEAAIKCDSTMTEAEKAVFLNHLKTPAEDGDADKMLTVQEVARRLHKSQKTVHEWCKQGYLKKVTIGKNSRASGVLVSSLEQWLGKVRTA
jgi:predicted DNA-binding transcriptional regulator AlpA